MSWLFGVNKGNNPDLSQLITPLPSGNEASDKSSGVSDGYRFDSSALERAATAARELHKSPYAREILEATKKQEEAKIHEQMNLIKQREMELANLSIDQMKLSGEIKMKILKEETVERQKQSDYQDRLSRSRHDDQLKQQARIQEENLRRQEESTSRQEAIRMRTLDKEFKMREDMEVKKIQAQVKAQSISDRENIDINIKKIQTEAAERRKTLLDLIQTAGDVVGTGMQTFLADKTKVTTVVVGLTGLAAGVYAAKFGFGVTAKYVESRLSKPSLVRETSRLTFTEAFKHPVKTFKRYSNKAEDALKGIVLKPKLETQLRDIAISTRLTKANKGYYKNVLFYGPPGTGKSMYARSLANHSGMDYAIMTGGDVSPMGADGVTAIHRVFDWAETSKKGLLLFIDEADAFLRKRDREMISENMRSSMNAFLYRAGGQSKNFMLVFASNLPEQFDSAINNRIDEMVEFDFPGLEERTRMFNLYFREYILEPAEAKRLKVASFDYGKKCSEVASRTEGFSGREISKLAIDWQTTAFSYEDCILTEEIIDRAVEKAIKTHERKGVWEKKKRNLGAEKSIKNSV